jgi:RNA polymerase sigma-70 factor (ECF subfamily)
MTDIAAAESLPLEAQFELHRRELTGYCYRMVGSAFEAEDAVQETLVRAWRNYDQFEGRAALRSWLYRIATNVCFDMLRGRQRRATPMDMTPVGYGAQAAPAPLPEDRWLQPVPDALVLHGDPAEVAEARDTIRLAFVAALQHLPARQRAVLILREVLRWKADEVADLLGTTVASVNSALQRARATLESTDAAATPAEFEAGDERQELLARYVDAFERYDIDLLVSLLHEDATMSMPPYPMWLRGAADIGVWHLGSGAGCRGSKLLPISANGMPGFAQWRLGAEPGTYTPWSIQVLEIRGDRIGHLHAFVDPKLFPLFRMPDQPPTG